MVQQVKVVIAMAIPGWSRIVEGENRLPEFSLTFTRVLGHAHSPTHASTHKMNVRGTRSVATISPQSERQLRYSRVAPLLILKVIMGFLFLCFGL